MISGLLSLLSPRSVTTANGSDRSRIPERFLRPLPFKESCNLAVIVKLIARSKLCFKKNENQDDGNSFLVSRIVLCSRGRLDVNMRRTIDTIDETIDGSKLCRSLRFSCCVRLVFTSIVLQGIVYSRLITN